MSQYFIDTESFSTASSIWMDQALQNKAPDGFYSFGGVYREMANGELLPAVQCPSCPEDPEVVCVTGTNQGEDYQGNGIYQIAFGATLSEPLAENINVAVEIEVFESGVPQTPISNVVTILAGQTFGEVQDTYDNGLGTDTTTFGDACITETFYSGPEDIFLINECGEPVLECPTSGSNSGSNSESNSLFEIQLEFGSIDCETVCSNYGTGANNSGTFYIDESSFGAAGFIYLDPQGQDPSPPNFYTDGVICRSSDGFGALQSSTPC